MVGLLALTLCPSSSAVPVFPNNVVAFPDRDFVTIEGYQEYIGSLALVQVTRAGKIVGSAKLKINEGDPAAELNHPGGACWGNDTDIQVTPDIRPGDVVSLSILDSAGRSVQKDETTVADAFVNTDTVLDGNTITIKGKIAPSVNRARLEQRVVNPSLKDTAVARRDIRALPSLVLQPDRNNQYQSKLEFDGDTFTATYVFNSAAIAKMAAERVGERMMSWQEEDGDGNRQGLTIAEYGESGGPGTFYAVIPATKDKAAVTWTALEATPGTPAVTGYLVMCTAGPIGEQTGLVAIVGPTATDAILEPLSVNINKPYTCEVRSMSASPDGVKYGLPFQESEAPPTRTPPTDKPEPAARPEPLDVTLAAGQITIAPTKQDGVDLDTYYKFETAAVSIDYPTSGAKKYTGPFEPPATISGMKKVCWGIYNSEGRPTAGCSLVDFGMPATLRQTPLLQAGIPAQGEITVKWTYPTTDAGLTGFLVYVKDIDTGSVVNTPAASDARSAVFKDLTNGKSYVYQVVALPVTDLAKSEWSPALTLPLYPKVTFTQALWKNGDFRIAVSCSRALKTTEIVKIYAGASVSAGKLIHEFGGPGTTTSAPGGVNFANITPGKTAFATAVAPATGVAGSIRLRNGFSGTQSPGTMWAVYQEDTTTPVVVFPAFPVSLKRRLSLRRQL